jgi:hypothetical protein
LHSTPSTVEEADFDALLSALTDEELRRYGEIAVDQKKLEYGHIWAEAVLWLAAVTALAWGLWQFVQSGVTRPVVLAVATSAACAYWPWRKMHMRRLWQGHYEAVAQEQARRGTKAD